MTEKEKTAEEEAEEYCRKGHTESDSFSLAAYDSDLITAHLAGQRIGEKRERERILQLLANSGCTDRIIRRVGAPAGEKEEI